MLGDRQMVSIKEKKEKLVEQISKLQARYKQLDRKDKVQERKARTRRLIERGAAMESKLSEDAISVFMMMSKSDLHNVDKWLVNHKSQVQGNNSVNGDMENKDIKLENPHNTGV